MTERPSIMVCTPAFGGMVSGLYTESLLALQGACFRNGIDFATRLHSGDALITRARAELVANFLSNPRATHMLFLDADIGFHPEQVFRLLKFNVDMAAAAYPRKQYDWGLVTAAVRAGRRPETAGLRYAADWSNGPIIARDDFARVRYAGTGFLLIRRCAAERMCAAYPKLKYRRTYNGTDPEGENQHRFALFECMIDPETGQYHAEDYAFCKRWTDIGGEIWLDLQSQLIHLGMQPFFGNLRDVLVAASDVSKKK